MNILAIGDIVGNSGISSLKKNLNKLKDKYNIDFTIVNAENAGDGMGLLQKQFDTLKEIGVDCITMGNHTWGKKDIFNFIDDDLIIRPANYPKDVAGKGFNIYEKDGKKICVINLLGRVGMSVLTDNPFSVIDEILSDVEGLADIIILDFHAEATAEKKAMAYFLDGRASIVFGTHTHVQTADETILKNGLGYITDIGMTGPIDSIIGMDIYASLKRFITTIPERYKVSDSNAMLNGVIFVVDDQTNKVLDIQRIYLD